jgi:hypothetical protein
MPLPGEPLIRVEWRDSCGAHGWHEPEVFDGWQPSRCISVGYLIRECDSHIIIAPHVTVQDQAGSRKVDGVLCIPKEVITSRRVLMEG